MDSDLSSKNLSQDPNNGSSTVTGLSPTTIQSTEEQRIGPLPPGLLGPIQLEDSSSFRVTPGIANGFVRNLNLTSSEESEEDSLDLSSDSSMEEEMEESTTYGLPRAELATGLCYDERMRFHSEVAASTGESVHPEDPRRIYYIFQELVKAGLVADGSKKFRPVVSKPLQRISARHLTEQEACLVHTPKHWQFVQMTASMTNEELIDLSDNRNMDSIYFNQFSFFSGKLAAGGAIETCRAVVKRDVKNAIAVIRPPGHHAEVHCTMGFCLFNNVCIASRVCQEEFGKDCRKILIVDWDVHHGNGCQKAFYDNPNILYISIHVHMNGSFYPSGDEGDMFHVGSGTGLGLNVNIPWPTKGMGDGDYMYAFQHLVMPIASEFDPDLVIVASGFDAAAGDELGGCFVTPPCYAHMTHMLMSLAGGKVAVCLEGGYNLKSISKSALAVTRTLMGEPPDRLMQTSATITAVETIQQVKNIQSKYWRCMYPKEPDAGIAGGERMHDLLRDLQALNLYKSFKMTELHIFRETISRSFDKQVLASPSYENKRRLLVMFHDPPETQKDPNILTNEVNPYRTWIVDESKSYHAHCLTSSSSPSSSDPSNWGTIDINIPTHITIPESGAIIAYDSDSDPSARNSGLRLALYIWENYIEPYNFPEGIVLMGVGQCFHAVAKLLSADDGGLDAERYLPDADDGAGGVRAVVGFISTHPVRPVKPQTQNPHPYNLGWGVDSRGAPVNSGTWYRLNSRVYTVASHHIWTTMKDNPKRSYRKYGGVVEAQEKTVAAMMKAHRDEVWGWIEGRMGYEEEENNGADEDETMSEDEGRVESAGDRGVLGAGSGSVPGAGITPRLPAGPNVSGPASFAMRIE